MMVEHYPAPEKGPGLIWSIPTTCMITLPIVESRPMRKGLVCNCLRGNGARLCHQPILWRRPGQSILATSKNDC